MSFKGSEHRLKQLRYDVSRLRDHHKDLERLKQEDLDLINQVSKLGRPPPPAAPPTCRPETSTKLSNEELKDLQERTNAYYQSQIDSNNYDENITYLEETSRRQTARWHEINKALSQQMRVCAYRKGTLETEILETQNQADQSIADPLSGDGDDASESSLRGHLSESNKTITFDEVFRNGCADQKHTIVEWPNGSGCYYIIRCDLSPCRQKHFPVDRPLAAGSAHLNQVDHDEPVGPRKPAPYKRVVELLGTQVLNCTDELASENNRVREQSRDEAAIKNHRSDIRTQSEAQSVSGDRHHMKRRKTDIMQRSTVSSPTRSDSNTLKGLADEEFEAMSHQSSGRAASSARRQKRMAERRPVDIEAGEVYCIEQGTSKTAVIVVPIFQDWPSHRSQVLGTAEAEGFFKSDTQRLNPVPTFCIDYDAGAQTAGGWKDGFADGGKDVTERKYPVVFVCGERYTPANTKRTWVAGKDILTYEPGEVAAHEVRGVNDYRNQMDKAEKAESAALRAANDDEDYPEPEEAHRDAPQQTYASTPDLNRETTVTRTTSLPDVRTAEENDNRDSSSLARFVAQAWAQGQSDRQTTSTSSGNISPQRTTAATTPPERSALQSDHLRAPVAHMAISTTAPGSDGDSDGYAGSEDDIPAALPGRHAVKSKTLFTHARFIPNSPRGQQPARESTYTTFRKSGTNTSPHSVGRRKES